MSAPEAEVRVGRAVVAWALQAVLGVLVLVLLLVAWGTAPSLATVCWCVAGSALVGWRPQAGLTALVLLVVAAFALSRDPLPLVAVMGLVLLTHLVLWLAALVARTEWDTDVEVAVLVGGLRSGLPVQLVAQVLAVVGVALSGGAAGGDVWRALALVAAVGVAVLVLPRAAYAR
ncbi:hypothetical protein [Cellulomonas sp. HZM]|uniref:hypothetical protein n=1 Tax=Cellulomonas sp. HZM TaxID=1454010 RepID=UPI0004935E19|nr:hypothetical protein [Cellulomonas sp. HZM]